MDQKNIETVLSALAEKIRDLELEVSLREYEIEKLKEENARLKDVTKVLEKALAQEADDGEL